MKKIITSLFVFLISGCVHTFIVKTTYEPTKTITIGYEDTSFNEVKYKVDAKKKADEFCGKPARFIGDEFVAAGPSAAWGVLSMDKNKHVTFSCE